MRYLAFLSQAPLDPFNDVNRPVLYSYDCQTQELIRIREAGDISRAFAMTSDGEMVAFFDAAGLWTWNRSNRQALLRWSSTTFFNGNALTISDDRRFAAFTASRRADSQGAFLVVDLAAGTTARSDLAPHGVDPDGAVPLICNVPVHRLLSADGQWGALNREGFQNTTNGNPIRSMMES